MEPLNIRRLKATEQAAYERSLEMKACVAALAGLPTGCRAPRRLAPAAPAGGLVRVLAGASEAATRRQCSVNARWRRPRRDGRTAAQATWFEADSLKRTNPRERERQERSMAEDLRVAAEQLLRLRRERLREVYAAEMAAWQRELAAKGLTIETRV